MSDEFLSRTRYGEAFWRSAGRSRFTHERLMLVGSDTHGDCHHESISRSPCAHQLVRDLAAQVVAAVGVSSWFQRNRTRAAIP